jgi:hypothetical protein
VNSTEYPGDGSEECDSKLWMDWMWPLVDNSADSDYQLEVLEKFVVHPTVGALNCSPLNDLRKKGGGG